MRYKPIRSEKIATIVAVLNKHYPEAHTELRHTDAFQLLIATILSAQCTDEQVNKVTPSLFARYPDAQSLAAARIHELETMIRSTGFYKNKARSIMTCCTNLTEKYHGMVPHTIEQLTQLGGVGRKTANVVLGNAFGVPGIVVDTHVKRLA
ncbi:MAG: endonuclease III, partial [Elusimicrobia bacterium]|nr:endonuclease III [Elusimicrobiota bacterium]MBD3411724.1 endonuclease III [Elusimicrobiota bacterium]